MAYYHEHPSRAGRSVAGELVVHPDAQEEDCTVWFFVRELADGEPEWEGLLARRLSPDRARIAAVPMWAYGVNLGDEVALVNSDEGAPVARALVTESENYTFRVHFPHDGDVEDHSVWRDLMADLEPYDCWFDVVFWWGVAISTPAEHAQEVADYLQAREDAGELQYETGR